MSKPLEGITFTGVWEGAHGYQFMWEATDSPEKHRIAANDITGHWMVQRPPDGFAEGHTTRVCEAKATAVAVARLRGATFKVEP